MTLLSPRGLRPRNLRLSFHKDLGSVRDGSVSFEKITERRGDIFVMFDQDEGGMLGADEYVLFDKIRAADTKGNAGGRMQKGLTLSYNDIDTDSRVSKKEFLSNSTAWIAQVERHSDRIITSANFGPPS